MTSGGPAGLFVLIGRAFVIPVLVVFILPPLLPVFLPLPFPLSQQFSVLVLIMFMLVFTTVHLFSATLIGSRALTASPKQYRYNVVAHIPLEQPDETPATLPAR